jgi:retinol-binding protein 3
MKSLRYITFLTLLSIGAYAQIPLTSAEKKQVIDSVIQQLHRNYVFPEMADQMTGGLKVPDTKDPIAFAEKLTDDLRAVSHDKHLSVRYDPRWIAENKQGAPRHHPSSENYGFKEIKILEGNVGYLLLNEFSDPDEEAAAVAAAAMKFLRNASAIIIDLRTNGGGSPQMVQLLASYFFDEQPHSLTDIYWRPTDVLTEMKTLSKVEGTRLPAVPLYLLTSNRTFSAAEDFSYSLQNLKRVTIIGETTGGGAHPVQWMPLNDRFVLKVPSGRSISSITKTDWEGTGVVPDIAVPAKDALSKALEVLSAHQKDRILE